MALFRRLLPVDDGTSKKSDSPRIRPFNPPSMRFSWNGFRRRRIFFALVLVVATYVFIRNLPNDVSPVGQRYNPLYGSMASGHSKGQLEGIQAQAKNQYQQGSVSTKVHDEPVRFPNLASTLRTFASGGFRDNVLFILLHPASAAHLLPLACQMKQSGLNWVHVALMGRNQALPEDIMRVNGILPEDCEILWHDARIDFATGSSERRILAGIQQGYSYLHRGLAPAAVITDDARIGDGSQSMILERSVQRTGNNLLRFAPSTLQNMPWITLLEGSALAQIGKIEIEIVVQAHSESSGSLIQLLRSLKNANYAGLNIPRLSVELPPHADPAINGFLTRFKWPPATTNRAGQFTVRRRLNPKHVTPAEASLQTVEAFYPVTNPSDSHILFLNPDMEVSTSFMHYVMFSILHFRHGRNSNAYSEKLFGISLYLPEAKVDGTTPFVPSLEVLDAPFMLSQTPNGRGALYFGDRWIEFHSFLANRLATDPQLLKSGSSKKTSSLSDYPQWTQYALELMQVLGWYMIYPAFARDPKEQVAILHHELPHPPEGSSDADSDIPPLSLPLDRAWLSGSDVLGEETTITEVDKQQSSTLSNFALPSILRGNSTQANADVISPLNVMGLHSSSGELTEWFEAGDIASKYADKFSLDIGGCSSLQSRNSKKAGTVDYLFCTAQ